MEQEPSVATQLSAMSLDLAKFAWAFAVSSFFGFIRFIQRFAKKEDRENFDWLSFAIHFFTSGSVGVVTTFILGKRGLDEYIINFFLAVGGWGGVETYAFFQGIYQSTLQRMAAASGTPEKKSELDPKD